RVSTSHSEEERMSSIVKSIEVKVPVKIAYHQWTRFEEFPQFMEGVKEVRHQLGASNLHWKAEIKGKELEWDAAITEELPNQRIAWTSLSGDVHDEIVTIYPLSGTTSKVLLHVASDPAEMDTVALRVQRDLERFKVFIERRERQSATLSVGRDQ
ncbi:MAG: SRPBCC family protein, partial [Nitrospiraceae bacterium]